MLAPPRLLELIRDPRIIAAVASAITALTNGLSAANQKFVFMLIISSIRKPAFQIGLRTYPKTVTFCVAGDFGAGQGAGVSISTAICERRATSASAKIPATLRARAIWGVWRRCSLLTDPPGLCASLAPCHPPQPALAQTLTVLG